MIDLVKQLNDLLEPYKQKLGLTSVEVAEQRQTPNMARVVNCLIARHTVSSAEFCPSHITRVTLKGVSPYNAGCISAIFDYFHLKVSSSGNELTFEIPEGELGNELRKKSNSIVNRLKLTFSIF